MLFRPSVPRRFGSESPHSGCLTLRLLERSVFRTVLNCDDDDANRYVRSRILRDAGFEPVEAATGADALREAAERQPCVAIIDVRLPDVDGLEVCRRLKADPATAHIRVINISAVAISDSEKSDALEFG